MLHLIFQSSFDSALLQRIEAGDDVIFLENAIFRVVKQGFLATKLQALLKNRVYLHVLHVELETRGVTAEELVSGIKIIDYPDLVKLTEKNRVIKTWN